MSTENETKIMRKKAKPTEKHLEWADREIGVIIHYLIEVYNPDFKEYKTKKVRTELPPSVFRPDALDPEQWVRSAAELGAKYAVLVANHCSGFSLWQTKVNDYSCASVPWKDGKGDIVREFIDACKKYDIRPGLYYSTGVNGYYDINDEDEQDYQSEKYRDYVRCVEQQLTELWSEYGELFEIWFDGGVVPKQLGGPDVEGLLMKYQPDALTFQGPAASRHDLRWVGNELGFAPQDCWASYTPGRDGTAGSPDGERWMPAETDFPNRSNEAFGGGWSWRENEECFVLSPEHLLECYVNSVGRNSNMLIGMAISSHGDFQDEEQFIRFGKLLKKTFGTPKAELCDIRADFFTLCPNGQPVDYLVLSEDVTEGHSVLAYTVYADGRKVAAGQCIGHKRIHPLNGLTAQEITVTIDRRDGEVLIKSAAVY